MVDFFKVVVEGKVSRSDGDVVEGFDDAEGEAGDVGAGSAVYVMDNGEV